MIGRLDPRGLTARFALTIVLALVLAQAAMSAFFFLDRAHAVRGQRLPDRVATLARVIDNAPAADRPRLLAGLGSGGLAGHWPVPEPRDATVAGGPLANLFLDTIRAELGDPARPAVVRLAPGAAAGQRPTLHVEVALADGTWLVIRAPAPPPPGFFERWLVPWLVLIAVIAVAVALVAARRLTAPLARFAAAAERLGTEGTAERLPETGPTELRAATRAFNRMQERLSRFVEDRTRMLAAISHDLRTPLTRMRLRAELVEDPVQQAKMLNDIAEMEAMIGATLAFARDDPRREPAAEIDLAALLAEIAEENREAGRAVSFAGPARCPFPGRRLALRRALGNLVDNAVAYGETARIRLLPGRDEVTIEIEDDGPGIPAAARERVFAPFQRLDPSRNRDTGGVGLGLAVARNVARAHGGDIELADAPGGGLLARVILPRAV
ncbi:MAG: ATP-binding protein [Dongiaceae bacterium]